MGERDWERVGLSYRHHDETASGHIIVNEVYVLYSGVL